jgi:hypothetical protein
MVGSLVTVSIIGGVGVTVGAESEIAGVPGVAAVGVGKLAILPQTVSQSEVKINRIVNCGRDLIKMHLQSLYLNHS